MLLKHSLNSNPEICLTNFEKTVKTIQVEFYVANQNWSLKAKRKKKTRMN